MALLKTLTVCILVLSLFASAAAFSPSVPSARTPALRSDVTCRLEAGEGMVSRRGLLKSAVSIALVPTAVFAQDAATSKPPEKKKTAQEVAAEKKRLEDEAQANAEAFDASLGFFGCSFWGLEKKPNSGACQPKSVK